MPHAQSAPKVIIAGAGSIGCYVGACLMLDGHDVTLLLRPRLAEQLTSHGLTVSDYQGRNRTLAMPAHSCDPAILAQADVILVTVKSAATAEMAQLIASHARAGTRVLSLQNGIGNADLLRNALPAQQVIAGMVPFNVVQLGEGRFHRASEGAIAIGNGQPALLALLNAAGLGCGAHADMQAVLWGKLLLNLNNALNALAGIPLLDQLQDRRWRCLLAGMMSEALAALQRAGIKPARVSRAPARLLPHLLRLPNPIFRRLAASMLKIDPQARSSMWEDLQQGRQTEVGYLQGAVAALAAEYGLSAPICAQVMAAIQQAEQRKAGSPSLDPAQLLAVRRTAE